MCRGQSHTQRSSFNILKIKPQTKHLSVKTAGPLNCYYWDLKRSQHFQNKKMRLLLKTHAMNWGNTTSTWPPATHVTTRTCKFTRHMQTVTTQQRQRHKMKEISQLLDSQNINMYIKIYFQYFYSPCSSGEPRVWPCFFSVVKVLVVASLCFLWAVAICMVVRELCSLVSHAPFFHYISFSGALT